MRILANGEGSLLEEPEFFGEGSFLAAAIARFPELKGELTSDAGVHIWMAVLERETMRASAAGDLARVHELFGFLVGILGQPRLHPEIPNAIAISYVVPSVLAETESGPEAIAGMPSALRELVFSDATR